MSSIESKPYVVSADSQGLLTNWAREKNITVPDSDYFRGMLRDLEKTLGQYFDQVDIVPEDFLRQGMNSLVSASPLPVVSLDRAYINASQKNLVGFLDATRTVDVNLTNTGLGSRALQISLERQMGQLINKLPSKVIALVDDVIFEGKTMLSLIAGLQAKGITVDTIFSGITIKEGQELLENNGLRVKSLLVYDQVIDEICQRDFVVGAPYSGRSVVNGKNVVEGAPYLYPFGKPVEWASIPAENADSFSLFCLYQALRFWDKTEQLSGKPISTQEIAKPVFGLDDNPSIKSALSEVVKGIK